MASQCRILALPAELRIPIYEHLLRSDQYLDDHYDSCFPAIRGHRECSLTRSHAGGILKRKAPPCQVVISPGQCAVVRNHYETPDDCYSSQDTSLIDRRLTRSVEFLRACRTFHNEAIDLLYDATLFVVDLETSSWNPEQSPPFISSLRLSTPLSDATFLRNIKHLSLRFQIQTPEEFETTTHLLTSLTSTLSRERTSFVATLDLHKAGNACFLESVVEQQWQDLTDAIKGANVRSDIVLNANSQWLRRNTPRFEQLAEALGGQLKWRKGAVEESPKSTKAPEWVSCVQVVDDVHT